MHPQSGDATHGTRLAARTGMTITMAGVFDDAADARDACRKLEAAGIDRRSIRMTEGAVRSSAILAGRHQPGRMRRFFAELFGIDDDASGHYAEAVRRGSAVVSAHGVEQQRVDLVKDVLLDCGAIDIDQRVEQWRTGGWSGHDDSAPALTREQIDAEHGTRSVRRGGVRMHRVTERPIERLSAEPRSLQRDMEDANVTASLRNYSGPERRRGAGSAYAGADRRAGG